MAAGAPRHRAPKKSHGSTGNVLQALGVAGGGLLAVSVMTVIAGGPAENRSQAVAAPSAAASATPESAVAGHGRAVVLRTPAVVVTPAASIWSVGDRPRPRPIGPTIPAPPTLAPAPQAVAPAASPDPHPHPQPDAHPDPPAAGPAGARRAPTRSGSHPVAHADPDAERHADAHPLPDGPAGDADRPAAPAAGPARRSSPRDARRLARAPHPNSFGSGAPERHTEGAAGRCTNAWSHN